MSRRCFVWGAMLATAFWAAAAGASGGAAGTPSQALEKLSAGNKRYAEGAAGHPNTSKERRVELAAGQHPFAVVVGCSDSRVPPEVVFDQGLGDLFVVRTAGNLVDEVALGSIEYAVEHLGTPIVIVLGHEKCGACTAALEGGEAPGRIGKLVELLRPAVAKGRAQEGDAVENTIRANVALIVAQLKGSTPILSRLVEEGRLQVIGARYDLDTGLVEFLE